MKQRVNHMRRPEMKDPYSIIKRPTITEKSTILRDKYTRDYDPTIKREIPKYTFEVNVKANKIEIRHALEQIFPEIKGKIKKINTIKIKGKIKGHLWRYKGKQPDRKKAIVTLEEGTTISHYEGI
jgi:large subunit ribosomal protein L23